MKRIVFFYFSHDSYKFYKTSGKTASILFVFLLRHRFGFHCTIGRTVVIGYEQMKNVRPPWKIRLGFFLLIITKSVRRGVACR